MARIAGVDLPREKKIEIGLTYIFGIGGKTAQKILDKAANDPAVAAQALLVLAEMIALLDGVRQLLVEALPAKRVQLFLPLLALLKYLVVDAGGLQFLLSGAIGVDAAAESARSASGGHADTDCGNAKRYGGHGHEGSPGSMRS
jgi:hypothetical protein